MKLKGLCHILLGYSLIALPAQAKDLIIGVEDFSYLPIAAYQDNQYSGFARELFDEFAKVSKNNITYKAVSIADRYTALQDGKINFLFPGNPAWLDLKDTARNGKKLNYSEPVLQFTDGSMVKPENKDKTIDSIKTLGTIKGFSVVSYETEIKADKIKVVESDTLDDLLKQVIAGKIDAAYITPAVAQYQLTHVLKQPNALVFSKTLPRFDADYFLVTIQEKAEMHEFNRFLEQKADWIKQLKKKYELQ